MKNVLPLIPIGLVLSSALLVPVPVVASQRLVIERGPHHKVVQEMRQTINEFGQPVSEAIVYTVLGNGMHRQNQWGAWVETKPVVLAYPDAIVCTGATYRVILNRNVYSAGCVDMETPEGDRIISHPLGISFFDPESGESALLAATKDSYATIVDETHVVYQDAFKGSGIEASIIYGYSMGRFYQHVTFTKQPNVDPSDYGFGKHARLEILTEFLAHPEADRQPFYVYQETDPDKRAMMAAPDIIDERIDFGEMRLGLGLAFLSQVEERGTNREVQVCKQLVQHGGRTILHESVPWIEITNQLRRLPRTARLTPSTTNLLASIGRKLPAQLSGLKEMTPFDTRLATLSSSLEKEGVFGDTRTALAADGLPQGFVMDYETVNGSLGAYTFESGETYLITNYASASGATFEGGAVIKYCDDAYLSLSGSATFATSAGNPVVFTAVDDDTAGAPIEESTGDPSDTYAGYAISCSYFTSDLLATNIDVRYADTALICSGGSYDYLVSSSIFSDCSLGAYALMSTIILEDLAMCDVSTWYSTSGCGCGCGASVLDWGIFSGCGDDADEDGMLDQWEFRWFGNRDEEGTDDWDSDNVNNYTEFLQGRNPTVAGAVEDTSGATELTIYTPLK